MDDLNNEEKQIIENLINSPKGISAFMLDLQSLLVFLAVCGLGIYKNDNMIILAGLSITAILQIYLITYRIKSLTPLQSAIQKLYKKDNT